jgi:hypothetical protein
MNVYNDRVLAEEIADFDKFRKITTAIYSDWNDRADYRVSNAVLVGVFDGVNPIQLLSCVGGSLNEYEY